jgi:hypothetical protein
VRLELLAQVEHADALLFASRRLVLQLCGWLGARQGATREAVLTGEHDRDRNEREIEALIQLAKEGQVDIAVVGNDACWNAEYQIQVNTYGAPRAQGCTLLPTRYDRVVEALGGHGEHVTKPADIRPAIERALASGKPALVNVEIRQDVDGMKGSTYV